MRMCLLGMFSSSLTEAFLLVLERGLSSVSLPVPEDRPKPGSEGVEGGAAAVEGAPSGREEWECSADMGTDVGGVNAEG